MTAYYKSTIRDFMGDDPNRICGLLAKEIAKTGFRDHKNRQTKAWEIEIDCLKEVGRAIFAENSPFGDWGLLLEYPIPRRQKRIDVVLLARDVILCIEFKTDAKHTLKTRKQVEDYALDLRDFHEESRDRRIVPIAVSTTAADDAQRLLSGLYPDLVRPTLMTNKACLANTIRMAYHTQTDPDTAVIDINKWDASAYHPVPTIIEAAEALYAGHDVKAIAHSHAGDQNLNETIDRVITLVRRAEKRREKIACFITGIPGAGKTLAGLNIAHNPSIRGGGRAPGVFLSGNGPLVKVIRKALERDFKQRVGGNAQRTTGTFIQNVHTFIKFNLKRRQAPHENLIVFDEAQRAWDALQVARKHGDTGETRSEPEMMLSIMDRHKWAVVVALVGGGQEIYQGEAGLQAWGLTLVEKFPKWRVAAPPQALSGDASIAGHRLFEQWRRPKYVLRDRSLHLNVNRRAYRAQRVTEWVEAVLRADATAASKIARDLTDFPLKITRSLVVAREWLTQQARGLRRAGLVASSGGIRLRAEGLELSSGFRRAGDLYVNWFLKDPTDIRSSNQLEVAASEFECQGLELDWVGVCWSGDFTYNKAVPDRWTLRTFRGDQWNKVPETMARQYLINKYRVLLTRAREGMIIWIPQGSSTDITRPPEWFDHTAEFLRLCGLDDIAQISNQHI